MPERPRDPRPADDADVADEIRAPGWPRRLTAELAGTFALVLAAAGTDAVAQLTHGVVSEASRAVAPALVVAALIYSIGDASGAHFNPAVTLAFAAKRLVPVTWLAPYWLAQLGGATLAAASIRLVLGDAIGAAVSRPKLVDPAGAVAVEAVLTLLLLVVILGTAERFRVVGPNAALAVGATIAACGLIGLPVEGASMNPARSLGPALVAGKLDDAWIYVMGPILGAIGAVLLTTFLHGVHEGDGKAEEAARGHGSGQP